MGYFSVNKVEITRTYDPREIVARVYCEELGGWEERRFRFEAVGEALAWVRQKLEAASM